MHHNSTFGGSKSHPQSQCHTHAVMPPWLYTSTNLCYSKISVLNILHIIMHTFTLSVESQKGVITIQQCPIEDQKGTIAVLILWQKRPSGSQWNIIETALTPFWLSAD